MGSGSGSGWLTKKRNLDTRKVFWKAMPRDARVRIRDTRVNLEIVLEWSGKALWCEGQGSRCETTNRLNFAAREVRLTTRDGLLRKIVGQTPKARLDSPMFYYMEFTGVTHGSKQTQIFKIKSNILSPKIKSQIKTLNSQLIIGNLKIYGYYS